MKRMLLFHLPLIAVSAFVHDLRPSRHAIVDHQFYATDRPRTASSFSTSSSALSQSSYDYSKWDNLTDDEDESADASVDSSPMATKREIPSDMKYNAPNMKRQARTYDALASIGDADLVSGVWLQSPADGAAFFVGWIARISDVTPAQAIERQYPLIERHAWALRPNELHPSRGPFLVYFTEGDINKKASEGDTTAKLTQVLEEDVQGAINMDRVCVGFVGASYDDKECDARGFRMEMMEAEEESTQEAEEESVADNVSGQSTSKFDIDYDELDFSIPDTVEDDTTIDI